MTETHIEKQLTEEQFLALMRQTVDQLAPTCNHNGVAHMQLRTSQGEYLGAVLLMRGPYAQALFSQIGQLMAQLEAQGVMGHDDQIKQH